MLPRAPKLVDGPLFGQDLHFVDACVPLACASMPRPRSTLSSAVTALRAAMVRAPACEDADDERLGSVDGTGSGAVPWRSKQRRRCSSKFEPCSLLRHRPSAVAAPSNTWLSGIGPDHPSGGGTCPEMVETRPIELKPFAVEPTRKMAEVVFHLVEPKPPKADEGYRRPPKTDDRRRPTTDDRPRMTDAERRSITNDAYLDDNGDDDDRRRPATNED